MLYLMVYKERLLLTSIPTNNEMFRLLRATAMLAVAWGVVPLPIRKIMRTMSWSVGQLVSCSNHKHHGAVYSTFVLCLSKFLR